MDAMAADLLRRCAGGEISSAVALVRLLIAYGDLDKVRTALANLAQAGSEAALLDGIARIRELLDRNPAGSALVQNMLREERTPSPPGGEADGIERCRDLFDRLVATNAEASVALYSLGEARLLDAATAEVIELLESLGVLGPERQVLDIGCGIGRIAQALAGKVAAITGIDIAPGMIKAARRSCAGLPYVTLRQTSGRDLSPFPAAAFDLVLAIDAMPYVYHAGSALVAAHFAEVARVLSPGGDFVILNMSYRGDLELDREDARRLAQATGLRVLRDGTTDLRLWDGTTFHLRRPADTLRSGDQDCRSSMRP
jgi:ubiquinone/menaquinone biosynthesis C-methylase UbiE